jgi:hypothetical protein
VARPHDENGAPSAGIERVPASIRRRETERYKAAVTTDQPPDKADTENGMALKAIRGTPTEI